jgi:hypothetical protein
MISKVFGRRRIVAEQRYYPGNHLEGLMKPAKTPLSI